MSGRNTKEQLGGSDFQSQLEKISQMRTMITGKTAGTGATSAGRFLAERLAIPFISGGRYYRALAAEFDIFRKRHPTLSLVTQYQQFLHLYQEAMQEKGVVGVSALMQEGIATGAKGDVLATFNAAINRAAKKTGKTDPTWDNTVDLQTVAEALGQPGGFVWEAKLAILALKIDQLQTVVRMYPTFLTLPYLRVLLTVDPKIAAQRVGQRENRQVVEEEVLTREQFDMERYQSVYTVGGEKITFKHLKQSADIKIDTKHLAYQEVAHKIFQTWVKNFFGSQAKQTFAHRFWPSSVTP